MGAGAQFDVFLDLSTARVRGLGEDFVSQLRGRGLVDGHRRVTAALPNGAQSPTDWEGVVVPQGSPSDAFGDAIKRAAESRRGLAVVTGAWLPGVEALAALADLLALDPLVGTAQPRFAAPDDGIWIVPWEGSARLRMARPALTLLPKFTVTPELISACLMISPAAVLATDQPESGLMAPSLARLLTTLRRRGFRNAVSNRVVVSCDLDASQIYPQFPKAKADGYVDDDRVRKWLGSQPDGRMERTLAGAFTNGRPRLLLDCRGMHPIHNGAAEAILGFLTGIAEIGDPRWVIDVLVLGPAARFHHLAKRDSNLNLLTDLPKEGYVAAVRLTQPWSVQSVAELHVRARFVAFEILDTIAWDVVYLAPDDRLDHIWRFVALWSDGLLFDSTFSRQRFQFRFPVSPTVRTAVTRLSLHADDYASSGESHPESPYVLIAGNSYAHKDVDRTAELLASAFPYLQMTVIGGSLPSSGNVTVLPSGHLSAEQFRSLVGNATVVVYPSFYEGFGLPAVMGLAAGRTVVVRESPLWAEIASQTRMLGSLVPFADEWELVEAVGHTLEGRRPDGLTQGDALAAEAAPGRWADAASEILDLLDSLVSAADTAQWMARDTALALGN